MAAFHDHRPGRDSARDGHVHAAEQRTGRYPWRPALHQHPSDYLRTNIWLTTSGMAWAPAIMFAREVAGSDRVLYAMNYPFQAEAAEVVVHEDLPISAEEKRYLFEEGSTKVFGLAGQRV